MAIVALILAGLLVWLAGRSADPPARRILRGIAAAAAGFALYLVFAEPDQAFDVDWVARLITRVAAGVVRDLLR
jgi:hypothetical protein